MEKEYAQALFALAQKEDASAEKLVTQLVQHLRGTGRDKLLPRILRELRRIDARTRSLGELLEVASEAEAPRAAEEAGALGITAAPRINPDLVSGWRARTGSRIIDRSGKRALLELYSQIVANA